MSRSSPSYTGFSTPDSRFLTNSTDLYRTRRTNASDFPSGDGVGRIDPPGPVTRLTIFPVSRSSRLIT